MENPTPCKPGDAGIREVLVIRKNKTRNTEEKEKCNLRYSLGEKGKHCAMLYP